RADRSAIHCSAMVRPPPLGSLFYIHGHASGHRGTGDRETRWRARPWGKKTNTPHEILPARISAEAVSAKIVPLETCLICQWISPRPRGAALTRVHHLVNLTGDALRDPRLHLQDVAQLALVSPGPQVPVQRRDGLVGHAVAPCWRGPQHPSQPVDGLVQAAIEVAKRLFSATVCA